MHKPVSLIRIYLFSLLLVILLFFPLLGFFWINQEVKAFRIKSNEIRAEYINSGKETIKSEVDNAVAYIHFIRGMAEKNLRRKVREKTLYGVALLNGLYQGNKEKMSLSEMKVLAHDVLSSLSWDNGRGYFFAEDLQGNEIINPNNPELENTNILNLQDSKGTYLVREIIQIAESGDGEGFVSYFWNKPGYPDKFLDKISYVKLFEPFGWVIGNGKYLDDEEILMKQETLKSLEKFYFTESGVFFGGDWSGGNLFESPEGLDTYRSSKEIDSSLVNQFISVAREGSGFIESDVKSHSSDKGYTHKSISYISGISEWELYIGSAIDLGEIEKLIDLEQSELKVRIRDRILGIMVYIAVFILLSALIVLYVSRRVKNNLKVFKDFFYHAAHNLTVIDTGKLFFRESVILANSANHMIAERQKDLNKLIESEKKLYQILEAINIPLAIGKDGSTEYLNRCFMGTFGYTLEDMPDLERMWEIAYPDPEYRKEVQESWNRAIEATEGFTKPFPKQYCRVRCRNGENRDVEIDFSQVGEQTLTTFRDLTVHNKREAEKKVLEEKLLRAQKMEVLGLMAGGVAHDLNNILSGIVGYPDLIMMSIDKDHEISPYVDAIKKSGLRAADVVADLLTIARGAASTKKLCSLNTIIDQYLESPEYKKLESRTGNIKLIRKYDPDLLNISCSEIHIKKCIMNLVMNSFEAMKDGGELTITTRNNYLDIPFTMGQYLDRGEYVMVSVQDTGHGITEEDQSRIFEPFYTKKVMGLSGTGLGLSVVWSTVQDHHGGIVLKSSAEGTVFELYFPVDRSGNIEEIESGEMSDYMGKGETVLIIDDEYLQQEIASGMVNYLGYRSAVVGSGEDALRWLESHRADILVLDMIMPSGMSGYQTYKKILRLYPEQKAIIASGYAQTMEVENTIKLGAGRFIRKPYTIEVLGKALCHELRKQ